MIVWLRQRRDIAADHGRPTEEGIVYIPTGKYVHIIVSLWNIRED